MKGIAVSAKWLRFLTWPGLACLTAGLVAGGLSGWTLLPTALLVLGIGLLLLGLSFSGQTAGAFWQQRSTQAGTNAVVATIAVLVILGLLNFLAVQNSARFDLTETQLFTLAPASKSITRSLEEPVRIVIFDPAQNPRDVELLESYRRENDLFSFEYIDPFANPNAAQAFGATQTGMVFLEAGGDRRFLQTIGVTANPEALGTAETLSERQITNALNQVISDQTLAIYFIQGHEEPPIDGSSPGFLQAVESLEAKDYQVRPLDLAEAQRVPAEASVVVVAGPAQDFFPAEVEALQTYLTEGGGVLLMLDPRSDAGLNSLLDDWGVIVDDRLVLDLSGAGQFVGLGPAAPIVSNYGNHPITQDFGEGRSFFPLARPVESRELPDTTVTPLLLTDAQSTAEAISDEGDLNYDPNALPEGPYVLGVALSRPAEDVPDFEAEIETDFEAEAEANINSTDAETDESPSEDNLSEDGGSDTPDEDIAIEEETPTPVEDAIENPESDGSDLEASDVEAESPTESGDLEEAIESGSSAEETEPEISEDVPEDELEADAEALLGEDLVSSEETDSEATSEEDASLAEGETGTDATELDEARATSDEARLVVIGNSSFAVDGSFNQQLNGDIFLNAVNWLGQGADATLSISPKTVTDRRLQMTGQQAWSLSLFSLLVLPLTGLVLAIVMALRRR